LRLPEPREVSRRHYAPGAEFHIGKIEMVANTGTYIDSLFHRYPDGKGVAALPLAPSPIFRALSRGLWT